MGKPSDWLRQVLPVRTREKVRDRWNCMRSVFLPEPYRSILPYTMVGLPRLRKLRKLVQQIDDLGIPGDVVECGTCNGGSGAILAQIACRSPYRRHTWLLDSFAGLPTAGAQDGVHAVEYTGLCRGNPENVQRVLQRVGVPGSSVTLVPGWFQDTLPTLPVSHIALLHIDADWYESVQVVLEHLFDKVEPGGFVVFDDFGYWEGCRKASTEFLHRRGIQVSMVAIDGIGAYFQKISDEKNPCHHTF